MLPFFSVLYPLLEYKKLKLWQHAKCMRTYKDPKKPFCAQTFPTLERLFQFFFKKSENSRSKRKKKRAFTMQFYKNLLRSTMSVLLHCRCYVDLEKRRSVWKVCRPIFGFCVWKADTLKRGWTELSEKALNSLRVHIATSLSSGAGRDGLELSSVNVFDVHFMW